MYMYVYIYRYICMYTYIQIYADIHIYMHYMCIWINRSPEAYHLRHHGASFAEHFFGLRRQVAAPPRLSALELVERARQGQSAPPLSPRQQLASLAALVVLPWARAAALARFRTVRACINVFTHIERGLDMDI